MSISNLLSQNSYNIKANTINVVSTLLNRTSTTFTTTVNTMLYSLKYTGPAVVIIPGSSVIVTFNTPRIKENSSVFVQLYDNVPFVTSIEEQNDGSIEIDFTNITNANQNFVNAEFDVLIFDPPTVIDLI